MEQIQRTQLIGVFKSCLNILRDSENIIGEKALRNLSYLLILKLIEPRLGNEIDIDNYPYDFSHLGDDIDIERHKRRLLDISRFSNLIQEKPEDVPDFINYLWEDILSIHPSTKGIFSPNKNFDIKSVTGFQKLFKKIDSIDLVNTPLDILGGGYEEVIKDVMTGKTYGQFFTQPCVKNMMINLIDPEVREDGSIESCADPTMGTGGFLITYLNYILRKAEDRGIVVDLKDIKASLYGKEIDVDTYQLAMSNMLISSGHLFELFDRGDSIREPITRKFDCILANPPFGIKGLTYDDFNFPLKSEYIPIKSDNAVSLFIQAIIYMLKIGGRAAVVVPDGKDLFSKTDRALIAVRQYLLYTCELLNVIYLPTSVFTYTNIKTCVFYFIKRRVGSDVITAKDSKDKKNKLYNFKGRPCTNSVEFCEFNPELETTKILGRVDTADIVGNKYSLNYAEYVEVESEQYGSDVVVKTLKELCTDISTKKNIASSKRVDGEFRFFTCSKKESTHNTHYYDGTFIIHGSRGTIKGTAFVTNNEKFAIGTSMFISEVKDENECLPKYICYYLRLNESVLDKYIGGVAVPMISKTDYYKIKIPFPSIERQKEIVEYLDFIHEVANKSSTEKIAELRKLNECCLNNQRMFGENLIKSLGEVCQVNQGTYIKLDMKIPGEYPVYGGGNVSSYINQYNRENEIIVAKDGVSSDCVRYEKNKFFLNHHGWTLACDETVIKKYMFYYLQSIQLELLSIAKGAAQLGINQTNFYKIKIPVPPLDLQKEIIRYCEFNDSLIQTLETEIENNKKQAEQFIKSIMAPSSQSADEDPEKTPIIRKRVVVYDSDEE